MKKLIFYVLLFALMSCEKVESIKQYKVDILNGTGALYGSGATGVRTFETFSIYKGFNISNYHDCKSITFIGSITANIDPKSLTYSDTCYLEIYNITDNSTITNSTIYTTSTTPVWVESENILDYFPDKDVDITVRLRKSKNGYMVGVYSASLYVNF
jgi:hypothetical protein